MKVHSISLSSVKKNFFVKPQIQDASDFFCILEHNWFLQAHRCNWTMWY